MSTSCCTIDMNVVTWCTNICQHFAHSCHQMHTHVVTSATLDMSTCVSRVCCHMPNVSLHRHRVVRHDSQHTDCNIGVKVVQTCVQSCADIVSKLCRHVSKLCNVMTQRFEGLGFRYLSIWDRHDPQNMPKLAKTCQNGGQTAKNSHFDQKRGSKVIKNGGIY